jgi:hypothetical protein
MTTEKSLIDMTDEEFETWSRDLWRQMKPSERAAYLAGFLTFERRLLGRRVTAAWRARKEQAP